MPDLTKHSARIEIDRLDRLGRGRGRVGEIEVVVTGALPGEIIEADIESPPDRGTPARADARAIISASPDRVLPPCLHFGRCGGCTLQHLAERAYLEWKHTRIVDELQRHGVTVALGMIGAWIRSPPGSRRRIDLTVRRVGDGCIVGLNERASHRIVDIHSCPILSPVLFPVIAALRAAMAQALPPGASVEAVMNEIDGKIDLLIVPDRAASGGRGRRSMAREPTGVTPAVRRALERLAQVPGVARIAWGQRGAAETIAQSVPLRLSSLGLPVDLPPGVFLQASVPAEQGMQECVQHWAEGARHIVDLFAGIGTLSLPLLAKARVSLFEGDAAATAAVDAGLRRAALIGRGTSSRRDLAQDPLQADELAAFDFAVLDPPRNGALAQVKQIAASTITRVAMVSCNPDTFARDARILTDAGFDLRELVPIDQFLWSAHIELAAYFVRPRRRR